MTVKKFQSLVGSLMWITRRTRQDVAFAVHKVSPRTHKPTVVDWKLAKRIARYLADTKELRPETSRHQPVVGQLVLFGSLYRDVADETLASHIQAAVVALAD